MQQIVHELITVPKSINYNPVLAGTKSLAFIWICSFHLIVFFDIPIGVEHFNPIAEFRSNPLVVIISAGTYAVEIFMVLSGYLLAQDLWHHFVSTGKISTWQILLQRMIRLYPTFLFMEIIQTIAFSAICPCIWELTWIRTGTDGCLPTVWSSIVDFQAWVIIVPVFSLFCKLYGQSRTIDQQRKVRSLSIVYGTTITIVWVLLRVYRSWERQYEMHLTAGRHIPAHLIEYLQKEYPKAAWHLSGDIKNPELERERQVMSDFSDTFYLNFFMKYGALPAGFVLYLLVNPIRTFSKLPQTQNNIQPSAFQQFIYDHHVMMFVISFPVTLFLLMVFPHPASQTYLDFPHSFQMIYLALHRPLFVAIFCIFFTIIISVPQHPERIPWNPFYSSIHKCLSWNIWHFISKISYAGYYWNLPMCVVVGMSLHTLDLESGVPLPYQYLVSTILMFMLLIPQSVITHILIEQPITKWLRVKLHSKPSRMEYDHPKKW